MSENHRYDKLREVVKEVNRALPLGTFDDDPGGPWIAAGVPCHCAKGHPERCIGDSCPHHITRRPGWSEDTDARAR